ncbi:MAG: riboflavin synthase subunit alpha [candidate division Zixibacteria bacterium SM1_73]|nr:MAG: riboflavin synthase subunit alpha [candidate division Zixibacteria bacterium SM1_73]
MFTGIIEEVGSVEKVSIQEGNVKLKIKASKVLNDLKVGDSININGACQTVIETAGDSFTVEAVEETLRKTNLGQLKSDDLVNLERALRFSDRLGGHLVTGHVDCVGKIKSIAKKDGSFLYEFELPEKYLPHLVEKGSVAVDGISLTVVEVLKGSFTISIIPFTLENTTLGTKKVGDLVNIETDLIGKYVERILTTKKDKSVITEEWLKEKGW